MSKETMNDNKNGKTSDRVWKVLSSIAGLLVGAIFQTWLGLYILSALDWLPI